MFGLVTGGAAKLMNNEKVVSIGEDLHPFRGAWLSPDTYLYTADGKIKRRSLANGTTTTVEFSATLPIRQPDYIRHTQDLSSTMTETAKGILKPVISPDGKGLAFAALGKLWLMDVGRTPHAVTPDGPFVVTDPAWSSDGKKLVYSTDRQGSMDLWIYEPALDSHRRLTTDPGSESRPAWSPDGKRIAFVSAVEALQGQLQTIDLATGRIMTVQPSSFGMGYPSWSADSRSLMISRGEEYSKTKTYDAGTTNQMRVVPADGSGEGRDYTVVPHRSIGTRSAADGPVWSPDGRSIAFQMDQALWVMPVSPDGAPAGTPRKLADGFASFISWTGDSSQLLYVDIDELKLIRVAGGESRNIPLDLSWKRDVPTGTLLIHAGRLVDGVRREARANVDIIVERNRITAIEAHKPGRKADRFIDASHLTVMPGLIDAHVHIAKEFGSAFGRLLLAHGVTTIRSPGAIAADAIEERGSRSSSVAAHLYHGIYSRR